MFKKMGKMGLNLRVFLHFLMVEEFVTPKSIEAPRSKLRGIFERNEFCLF